MLFEAYSMYDAGCIIEILILLTTTDINLYQIYKRGGIVMFFLIVKLTVFLTLPMKLVYI